MSRIDRLEAALAAGPTEGPWDIGLKDVRTSAFVVGKASGVICSAPIPYDECIELERNKESQVRKTMAYIAACDPATISALLAENKALREALIEITQLSDSCGCRPCTGDCTSNFALRMWITELQDIARAALAQEKNNVK